MTKLQEIQLKEDVKYFLSKRGGQLEILGRKAGVGAAIINAILADDFKDVSVDHLLKIQSIVQTDTMKSLYKTADCRAFMNAKNRAATHRLMIGIIGDTGTGKSFLSQALAKSEGVFYYNVHLKKSSRVFLQDLLVNMGAPTCGNVSEQIDRIVKSVAKYDNPVIIIDEADKMYPEIRSAIHTLRDRTMELCGWMLVGMPSLKNNLIRGKEQGKQGYAEFWRRVNLWHSLEGLKQDEIKMILQDHGITDAETQRQLRKYTGFGDLINQIQTYKLLNE